MTPAGFIHDKLEIKFLILYIAARLVEPVPLEGLQELTMCDEGIDYFSFSECVSSLVQTEHLRLNENNLYCITVKGLRNSQICESSLPYSVRIKVGKTIAGYNQMLLRKSQVRSSVAKRDNGTYTVLLSLSDDVDNVMKLELMSGSEEMARDLCARFQKAPEEVYSSLLSALYQDSGSGKDS
jgi:hypothetical protein